MITMQYRIALPADYDMNIIRRRIEERGHLTDDFPHLAFKAYLYADRRASHTKAPQNLYAPFYLWHNKDGMNAFLGGAGFAGVVESFGRPVVQTWSVWRAQVAHDLSVAMCATREIATIPAHSTLSSVRDAEDASAQADLERGALAAISAYDPTSWTLLRFRIWRNPVNRPASHDADVYEIGHVSQPATHP
jgi:hypothetical protein